MKRCFVTVLLAISLTVLGCSRGEPSDWIGGFQQNDRWFLIRAQLRGTGEDIRGGTLDLIVPPYRQAIRPQTQLTEVRISNSSAHFRHVTPTRDIRFDGRIDGESISGAAQGKDGWSGPFRLFRVRFLEDEALREYQGAYQLGPGEFLYLQT